MTRPSSAGELKVAIDGKFYRRKANVKHVESFLAMLKDVGADAGILVTNNGYTKGAYERAQNGPDDLELEILSFAELLRFQGFGGLPYAQKYGAMVVAPFGWVLDGTRREGMLAALYQRGRSFDDALRASEWITIHIERRRDSLDEMLDWHEEHAGMKRTFAKRFKSSVGEYPAAVWSYGDEEDEVQRYFGGVYFDEHIMFAFLTTPRVVRTRNIKKLVSVVERSLPLNVIQDDFVSSRLAKLEKLSEAAESSQESAEWLIDKGELLVEFERFEEAAVEFRRSADRFPNNFGGLRGLLVCGLSQGESTTDLSGLLVEFSRIDPRNPTVPQTVMDLLGELGDPSEIPAALSILEMRWKEDAEAAANFAYHQALYFDSVGDWDQMLECLGRARKGFSTTLSEDHPVHGLVGELLAEARATAKGS